MTMTSSSKVDWCRCDDPEPGPDDDPRACPECGGFIQGAIIGGAVHPGFTKLGNGQAFFELKEDWNLNTGSKGGVNTHDEYAYFRSFGGAFVAVPHHTEKARRLGTEAISIDHIVGPDGEVETIVLDRRLSDLPDGPKFPHGVDDAPIL